ncbi:MAG TPA: acyl-CoA dehydrogenase family protein [Dehalococcoidia bacterium]|nr:acyl-CoA dehydrogenase family protein [Dehalococcoidia bacterium]
MNAHDLVGPVAADILNLADQAEAERRLPPPLMERLTAAGLFSIYTPRQFGGLELSLPEALRVVEEVARLDGSTGWTVALGVANDLFTCVLPDASAARVLRHGSALIAGAPGFSVRAEAVDGGYCLTGQWPFCSGAPNATWITVAAPVFDGETPRLGPGGPELIAAFLPPSDVEIVDTWHVTGLRGTGSHDLRVDHVFVPAEMAGPMAIPEGPRQLRASILARIPFMTLVGIAQSPPVCLGIARHAIDEFRALALAKERPFTPRLSEQVQAHEGLARAEAQLRAARCYWYASVECLWATVTRGEQLSLGDRANSRLASLTAVENSLAAVDSLRRLAGSSAIFQSAPFERCWRDVHTAAQHVQVQHGRWETAGRILFGLDPASPIV